MDVLNGKPVKAFIYQDHEAHIQVHMSAMQDPIVQQLVGQNPRANQIMAAMQAHIAEHVGFAYRRRVEEQLGIPLPAPGDEIPEELELQVSRLAAEASKRVLANSQAEVAQKRAQQQAQDPIVQMQQQELVLKQAEQQRKAQKDQLDIQLKQAELALKEKEMLADAAAKADELKIKEQELLVRAAKDADELSTKKQLEGMKMGISVGQSRQPRR
jgi:multidrug efflux pump subunit AcrA (membrane-fusion protein)